MLTTTRQNLNITITNKDQNVQKCPPELLDRYDSLVKGKKSNWTEHYRLKRILGSGGQGVVFLTERRGADGFTLPLAVKIFSPERFDGIDSYLNAMSRVAAVASKVAQIQQHNLLEIHNFQDQNQIRLMVMEWIDGYDLQELATPGMVERVRDRVNQDRWDYLNRVVVTKGPAHPRFKPGIAVAIIRDCLSALASLNRNGIIHGDIKPSNIMLSRTGVVKLIDFGSAFDLEKPPTDRACTPAYAAPEVLEGEHPSQQSDLTSLGYVLIEMLAGRNLFSGIDNFRDLLEAKRFLAQKLHSLMPEEVSRSELLMNFCRRLIAPDPKRRFKSAEDAHLGVGGATSFHRQLVKGDLASEYDNEIRLWIEELREMDQPE